jgi:signal transduction histidine kinase/CheY-like chemotaxis protein/AraC-like DNA-binding protein
MSLKSLYCKLLIIVFISLTGCLPQKSKKLTIGFSQCVSNDAWRQAMHEEMYRELSFYPELSISFKDAGGDSDRQILQIKELLEEGISLLIVSPNESDPITPIVEQVFAMGIPVIVLDRKINSDLYSAYIGGDNYQIGLTAGKYINNLLKGRGNILEVWGLKGSSPAKDRHRGLLEGLNGSEIKISSQLFGEWEKEVAVLKAQEFLSENVDFLDEVDLIFGHNDVMTIGVQNVLREAGYDKRAIGIDALTGSEAGIQAILDGVLEASFLYPTGGDKAIEIADKILNGESFQKEIILQTVAVDNSNVKIIKQQTDRIIDQQINISRQKDMIDNQLEIYQSQRGLLLVFGATLLVAMISLAYVFKSLRDKQEINKELKEKNEEISEQKEKVLKYSKAAEKANQQKIEFFTNISHEFRTPLTLIQGPLEEMLQTKESAPFKYNLLMIRKNTYRLLSLVNQLMDFRKIDGEKMQVNASELDLIPFLEDIMSVFKNNAKDNQIRYRLICEQASIKLWFDPKMMDKVFFNLLSNSFKFTPKKGYVNVLVEEDLPRHEVSIKVEDNGEGIDQEDMEHVFERFYQGKSGIRKSGTGLGLALAKELVNLHHGKIQVKSVFGENTTFEIRMKMGNAHFTKRELFDNSSLQYILERGGIITEYEDLMIEKTDRNSSQTILVVEDNAEIREYLKKRLEVDFKVLEAEDGDSAFSIAIDVIPDLITCDLMLGKGDGLDLIKKLKADPRTSSIPIIVISAKTSEDDRLEGVKSGVEDYITKPFNITLVKERIKSILANRKQIKEHYLHELPTSEMNVGTEGNDKKFKNTFTLLIEENISNPHFGVSDICKGMGQSKGQLYRKVKSALGYSVNDYIVKIRLKKAKYLLVNEELSIADVAFRTGFKTAAYFSTVFRHAHDVTPTEYRDKILRIKK